MNFSYNLLPSASGQGLQMLISLAILINLIFLVLAKKNIEKIFGLSALSSLVCLMYLILDAPDVAMTEAAIGACLSTIVLIIFITKIPEQNFPRKTWLKKILALICCVFLCYLFYHLSFILPEIGLKDNPINLETGQYYIKNTQNEIGIPAFVAAVLGSYRGFDTMGETLVILIAGIAVATIIGIGDEKK